MTSIRRRLLVTLALPIAGLVLISGFRVTEAQQRSRSVDAEVSVALAAGGPTTFITALMDERNITAVELLGLEDAVELRVANSAEAIEKSDALLNQLRMFLTTVEPSTREAYGSALDSIEEGLAAVRAEARSYDGPRNPQNIFTDEVYTEYTGQIGKLHTVNDIVISKISDADLRNKARAIANLSSTSDRQSQMTRFVLLAALDQGDPAWLKSEASRTFALWEQEAAEAIQLMASDPERQEIVADFYGRPNQKRLEAAVENFLLTGTGDPTEIITEAGDPTAPNAAHAWDAARASIVDRAHDMTAAANAQKRTALMWLILATAGSLVAALASARSLARPLLRLAEQARRLAGHQLPAAVESVLATPAGERVKVPEVEPVDQSGISEVDEIAVAINDVQVRALDLAAGQAIVRHNSAESLVNVARRLQGLVGRQIEMIDRVERDEMDPDRLESVYALDHLATRIRRNAESLVVLAGGPNRHRLNSGPPVPAVDVIRAAVAEVEQYERVRIDMVDQAMVSGRCSTDVAHILAELIENGLAFSPPSTEVVVGAGLVEDGYEITVTDDGIGMNLVPRAEANERLSGEIKFGSEATKYLGHHVIGALAQQHGISVRLTSGVGTGVTAVVTLPDDLLTGTDAAPSDRLIPSESAPTSFADLVGASRSLHEVSSARRTLDALVR